MHRSQILSTTLLLAIASAMTSAQTAMKQPPPGTGWIAIYGQLFWTSVVEARHDVPHKQIGNPLRGSPRVPVNTAWQN